MVTPFSSKSQNENITEIVTSEGNVEKLWPNVFAEDSSKALLKITLASPKLCADIISTKKIQELYKEQFDLTFISIAFSDCFMHLAYHQKVCSIKVLF